MAHTERPSAQEHNLTLIGRKTLKITGVSHVDRFDDEEITIDTCMGGCLLYTSFLIPHNLCRVRCAVMHYNREFIPVTLTVNRGILNYVIVCQYISVS